MLPALVAADVARQLVKRRKAMLADLLPTPAMVLLFNKHFEGDGMVIFKCCLHSRLRGHRVEREGSDYRAGRVLSLA